MAKGAHVENFPEFISPGFSPVENFTPPHVTRAVFLVEMFLKISLVFKTRQRATREAFPGDGRTEFPRPPLRMASRHVMVPRFEIFERGLSFVAFFEKAGEGSDVVENMTARSVSAVAMEILTW